VFGEKGVVNLGQREPWSEQSCGMKLMDKKNTDELMDMLGLNKMAIASGVRWFGHVLRRDETNVLREALQFNVDGRRGRGRPRNT